MATVTRERELLRELVALVRGECPSLLNEDSGGDVRLSMAIDDALASPPADLVAKLDALAEKWDRVFWRNLNDPAADDRYVSRKQAQEFRDELAEVRSMLKAQAPPASDPPVCARVSGCVTPVSCKPLRVCPDSPFAGLAAKVAAGGQWFSPSERAAIVSALTRQSDPPGLVALLKEPHFLGWPKTAAAGEYAYSRDAVMVSAEWYERLKALALPASPQAATKGDE